MSQSHRLIIGVQGSVLGPFFFLMYTLLYSLSALDLHFLDPAGRYIYLIYLLLNTIIAYETSYNMHAENLC